MLTKETMTNPLFIRVKIVNDNISIATVAGCKYYDLKSSTQILQNLSSIRTNINPSLNDLSSRKFYGQFNIIGHCCIFVTMNQGLIQIKN